MREKFKVEMKAYITIVLEDDGEDGVFAQAVDEIGRLLSSNKNVQIKFGGGMSRRVRS